MNELTLKDEALQLHAEIGMYAEQFQTSVYMMGKLMAKMKDRELYKELGYETFEDYTFKEFNLKKSQSAKFISVYNNLGEDYIQERQRLGVTKLYLLSQLSEDEREIIEVTAEDSSVVELKEQIKKLREENEKLQCSFFEVEKENKELKDKPVEVAVQEPDQSKVEELAEQIANEKVATAKQRIDELSKKLEEAEKEKNSMKRTAERVSILEVDNQMLKEKIEQDKEKAEELENVKKAYEMKLKNMEAKLKEAESTQVETAPAGADEETTFRFMMKSFVNQLNDITEFCDNAKDKELKGKLVGAIKKIMERLE